MAEPTIPAEVTNAFGSLLFGDMGSTINGKVGAYEIDRDAFRGEDEEEPEEDGQIPKIKLGST
jgi:hypothetical protein